MTVINEFTKRHNTGRDNMTYYAVPEYDKLVKDIKEKHVNVGKDPYRLLFMLADNAEAVRRIKRDREGAQ